jgi:hypothetical protein
VPMKTAICAVSAFVLREFSVQWHSRGECLQFQIPLAIQLELRCGGIPADDLNELDDSPIWPIATNQQRAIFTELAL